MEKKQKYILIAIAFALVVLCSGLTYAYFTSATPSESGSTIVAKGGTMNITYANGSGDIVMENIYPREKEWVNKTFTITGKNTTDLEMEYTIYLVTKSNNFSFLSLGYTLTGTSTNSDDTLVDVSNMMPLSGDIGELAIGSGVFKSKNATHTYSLKIYFPDFGEEQDDNQGKSYTGYVRIEESKMDIYTSSPSNTLIAGIRNNYPEPTKMLTNPLTAASAENEAVMSSMDDDYGKSYFFRGNVQNNFVSFAGMCWRIVRITGDGSIKLVLYDYSSASCTNTGDDLAFARYSGTTYTTKFNNDKWNHAYIGFMYGKANASTYAEEHANTNKSVILQNLETWYKAKLTSYTDKLADVIWCNDKSTVVVSKNQNIDGSPLADGGSGFGSTGSNYFAAGIRITGGMESQFSDYMGISLICPTDNDDGKLSKFTVDDIINGNGDLDYKIGLLTADEMILAGLPEIGIYTDGSWESANITSYLVDNAKEYYWSMTPYAYMFSEAYLFIIRDIGIVNGVASAGSVNALRPAIALKSDTTISGGDGTAANPFVVN